MTTPLLAVDALHAGYGKSRVLHGVSLALGAGELLALLGRNGVGKTTTLRALLGLIRPVEGRIEILGRRVETRLPGRITALGVGYVPEGRRVFANLSVEENLEVPLQRPGPWNVAAVYRLFPRLGERRAQAGRQLSGGEQEMLAIGRALILNPQLLVLDEPSQGLAPLVAREVFAAVARMRDEGMGVLLVEQNLRAAVERADRVCVLDGGEVVFSGSAEAFRADTDRWRDLAGATAGVRPAEPRP
ncbi:MAG: ABC transporter ATP-binding protein [Burkholderiales bacterium]|nr:ABC transporter ATP-binding protein [Burkholderiales bacterium]